MLVKVTNMIKVTYLVSADSSTSILDINTVDTVNENIATEISSKSNLPEVEQFAKLMILL